MSLDDIRWIAHLARLDLTEPEIEQMGRDLEAIVRYVGQLNEAATDGVAPLAHPHDVANVFRADEPAPSLDTDAALANAPERKGDFFSVPAVLE